MTTLRVRKPDGTEQDIELENDREYELRGYWDEENSADAAYVLLYDPVADVDLVLYRFEAALQMCTEMFIKGKREHDQIPPPTVYPSGAG